MAYSSNEIVKQTKNAAMMDGRDIGRVTLSRAPQ
jgi:hypothetical protein